MTEGLMNYAAQQAISGTTDVVSTNVYDAGTAKKVHGGAGFPVKLGIYLTAIGGTSPTFRARYVGADNPGLTTNPEIIADTGVSPALVAGDIPRVYELVPQMQKVAKRYYGVIFTLGGTSPTATANAQIGLDVQSGSLVTP